MKWLSRIVVVLALFMSSWYVWTYGQYKYTFYGDALGYYSFLPSIFVYDNLGHPDQLPDSVQFPHDVRWALESQAIWGIRSEKGYIVNQYTCGMSYLEAPFFFAAHAWAKFKGIEANAYSPPYDYAIKLFSLLFSLLGFFFIYKILLRYVKPEVARLTISLMAVASNVFWFALQQAGMSHPVIFGLFALFLFIMLKIHDAFAENGTVKIGWWLSIGLVGGLIVLIRPSDLILMLVFPLYQLYDRTSWHLKKNLFIAQWKGLLLAAGVAFLLWIPQLLYWKKITGHWFFDSYGDQSFIWSFAHYLDGILGSSNGWLTYSPFMGLALIGCVLYRSLKEWIPALIVVFVLYTFVIYSWYCYFYINGFGSRPMIHIYPLLAIPLGLLIQRISFSPLWIRFLFMAFSGICIWHNVHFCILQTQGYLNTENSSHAYNWKMLFRSKPDLEALYRMDISAQPDSSSLKKMKTLYFNNFNDSLHDAYFRDTIQGGYFMKTKEGDEYATEKVSIKIPSGIQKGDWIRCSGRFFNTLKYLDTYMSPKFVAEIRHDGQTVAWEGVRIVNKIGVKLADTIDLKPNVGIVDTWGSVSFFVQIPSNCHAGDDLTLIIWNLNKGVLAYDDWSIEWWR